MPAPTGLFSSSPNSVTVERLAVPVVFPRNRVSRHVTGAGPRPKRASKISIFNLDTTCDELCNSVHGLHMRWFADEAYGTNRERTDLLKVCRKLADLTKESLFRP